MSNGSLPRGRAAERGSLILQALIALLLLSIFFALAAEALMREFQDTWRELDRRHLSALADAGIATTLALLREGSAVGGLAERELAGGTIASRVEAPEEDEITIEAIATYKGKTKTVTVNAHRGSGEYFVTDDPRYWRGPAPGEGF